MLQHYVKEEYAIVLDFLPHGYPFDKTPVHRKTAIAQAIGKDHFILLELVPKKGQFLQPFEEIYMGEGKREEIHHIIGRIPLSKLTQTARSELDFIIEKIIKNNEKKFVDFFNTAGPINIRRHQIELLPGIGKKHVAEILEKRTEKPFTNLSDIKERVRLMPNPEKAIIKRIIMELNEEDKHRLFVGR